MKHNMARQSRVTRIVQMYHAIGVLGWRGIRTCQSLGGCDITSPLQPTHSLTSSIRSPSNVSPDICVWRHALQQDCLDEGQCTGSSGLKLENLENKNMFFVPLDQLAWTRTSTVQCVAWFAHEDHSHMQIRCRHGQEKHVIFKYFNSFNLTLISADRVGNMYTGER